MIKKDKFRPVVITLFALTIFAALSFISHNPSAFQQDQVSLRKRLENAMNNFTVPGELIFEELKDKGCTSDAVGLQYSFGCGYIGNKFFKDNKDPSTALSVAREVLEKNELKRYQIDVYRDGEAKGKKSEIHATLQIYGKGQERLSGTLKELIRNGRIASPKENEYLYGISVGGSYYSCTVESFWRGCPERPHPTD